MPGAEGGEDRWSVDHLFLDQDAVPIIVEVKRSADTCIRREVVGQMLDYAANAVVYWPIETLQARFQEGREDPEQDLLDFLDGETDPERFRQKAKTSLQTGRVRLIFAADEIPAELRRIVEFLNQQMDPAEVLAVEIKQYVSEDSNLRTLVPRVIGQTAEAQQKKSGTAREGRQWDEPSFFQNLESRRGADEANVARKILEWAEATKLYIWWGKGKQDGSFFPMFEHKGTWHWLILVWTYGRIEVQFQQMKARSPLDDQSKRQELRRRLNDIPGVDIPADGITRRPTIPLHVRKEDSVLGQFLATLDWVMQEI